MRLPTINVIGIQDGLLVRLVSFDDTPNGMDEAEALFAKWIREQEDISDDDINNYMEDDYFINGDFISRDGVWEFLIVHNTERADGEWEIETVASVV